MQQPIMVLDKGTVVRTHAELGDTRGLLVVPTHLAARSPNAVGVIDGYVLGHGGDVYWVRHEGVGQLAVYSFTEFELVEGQ